MEITENYNEKTGLFVRHGFIVSPAVTDAEAQGEAEETLINDHGVVGRFVQSDWTEGGTLVEIMTEFDPEDYWTD